MMVLRSLFMWAYIALSLPVFWVVAVLLWALSSLFDRRQRRLLHRFTSIWGAHYVAVSPFWSLKIEGREHVHPKGTYVLVSNHQSLGDILVLFALHRHFKWVAKEVVFKVPFIGWNMRMNDYVPLKRGDRESIQRMLLHCMAHLRTGSSVMLFPEGTRSYDGRMRPFKHGAFTLAVDAHVPIIPMAIEGTQNALPKAGFWFRYNSDVRVHVLPPVTTRAFEGNVQGLAEHVRMLIADELANMRGTTREGVLQPESS